MLCVCVCVSNHQQKFVPKFKKTFARSKSLRTVERCSLKPPRWATLYYRAMEYVITVSGSTNFSKISNDRWVRTSLKEFKSDPSILDVAARAIKLGAQAVGNIFDTKLVKEEILRNWTEDGLPFYQAGVLKNLRRRGGVYDYLCYLLGIASSKSIFNSRFVLAANNLVMRNLMPRLNHRKNSKSGYQRTWFPMELVGRLYMSP